MQQTSTFLNRPQAHPVRRALFQVHLWLGVAVGLYLTVICLSGSLLVFRSDMQRAAFPALLASSHTGAPADIVDVLAALEAAYPGQRVSGIDAPTVYRQTYLAYVAEAGRFHTILSDPGDAHVLGELPQETWMGSLQALHFNLLLGRTGRLLNQIAALCLLALLLSGAVIWWQGRRHWKRGLSVRKGPWPGLLRNLHAATGAWLWALLLMIALTACSLMFPSQFRTMVVALTPAARAEPATAFSDAGADGMSAAEVIRRARAAYPSEYISRVVLPTDSAPLYQINFARRSPTPLAPSAQRTRYFDRVTGTQMTHRAPPLVDQVIAWTDALHVGNFAGNGTRILWSLLGLVPPLLFVTGSLLWWRRVVRPAIARGH